MRFKKGISLPVDAVIIIAVAVLVLVVISVMFSSSTGTSMKSISHADAWNRGCSQAKVRGCMSNDFFDVPAGLTVTGYDSDGDGTDNVILAACQKFFADTGLTATDCRKKCCG